MNSSVVFLPVSTKYQYKVPHNYFHHILLQESNNSDSKTCSLLLGLG